MMIWHKRLQACRVHIDVFLDAKHLSERSKLTVGVEVSLVRECDEISERLPCQFKCRLHLYTHAKKRIEIMISDSLIVVPQTFFKA